MQYKPSRLSDAIKKFIYPPDARRSKQSLYKTIGIFAVVVAFGGSVQMLPSFFLYVVMAMFGVCFLLVAWLGLRTIVLAHRQYDVDDTLIEHEAGADNKAADYRQLDFSALRTSSRRGVISNILTWVAAIMAIIGLLLLLLIIAANEALSFEIIVYLLGMASIFLTPLVMLLIRRRGRLFQKQAGLGYDQFAAANQFSYVLSGAQDHADALGQLDIFMPHANLKFSTQHLIQGVYRGVQFEIFDLRMAERRGRSNFYGVLKFACSDHFMQNTHRAAFEEALDPIGLIDSVAYQPGYVYCIINDGMPSNRAMMIRLFQVFDTAFRV